MLAVASFPAPHFIRLHKGKQRESHMINLVIMRG